MLCRPLTRHGTSPAWLLLTSPSAARGRSDRPGSVAQFRAL